MTESNGSTPANPLLRLEVEDVVIAFAVASDAGDRQAMADVITDDFVVHLPAQGVTRGPGRDTFLDFAVATTAARRAQGEAGRHLVTNVRVQQTADLDGRSSASAQSYVTFVVVTADGSCSIQGFAGYDDRLVSLDGRWRLASRTITFAHEDPAGR